MLDRSFSYAINTINPNLTLSFASASEIRFRDLFSVSSVLQFRFCRVRGSCLPFGRSCFGMLNSKAQSGSVSCTPTEMWSPAFVPNSGCDIWALGIYLFATITARFPWEMAHIADARFAIMSTKQIKPY